MSSPRAQALLVFLVSLTAPLVVPFLIARSRWDAEPTEKDGHTIVRGDLTLGRDTYGTPDERLPGGMYEPTVASIYQRFGEAFCAWYWLGIRNRAHGLAYRFRKPATRYWTDAEGLQTQGEGADAIWLKRTRLLGFLECLSGYRVYSKDGGATFYATPVFTLKRA